MNVALLSLVLLTPAQDMARCDALLGDASMMESNKTRRDARLFDVVETERSREVIHAVSNWRTPKPLRLSGIRVREIVDTGAEAPAWRRRIAKVEMTGGPCPDGVYSVGVDDALGKKRSVVAVLEDGLLVDVRGQLRQVMLTSSALAPVRLIWRSPFAVSVAGGSSSTTNSASKSVSKSSSSKPDLKNATKGLARSPAQAALDRRDRAKARAAKRKANKKK